MRATIIYLLASVAIGAGFLGAINERYHVAETIQAYAVLAAAACFIAWLSTRGKSHD